MSEGEKEDESIEREDVVLPDHVIENFAIFGQLRVLTRHGRGKMTHQVVGEGPEMARETTMTCQGKEDDRRESNTVGDK